MAQYENNPITADPCAASRTQQQQLIKIRWWRWFPIPPLLLLRMCMYILECFHFHVYKENSAATCVLHSKQNCPCLGSKDPNHQNRAVFIRTGQTTRAPWLQPCWRFPAVTGASNPISISFNYQRTTTSTLCFICPWEEPVSWLHIWPGCSQSNWKIYLCSNTQVCDSDQQTVIERDSRRDYVAQQCTFKQILAQTYKTGRKKKEKKKIWIH